VDSAAHAAAVPVLRDTTTAITPVDLA